MYIILDKSYGIHIRLSGTIQPAEMAQVAREMVQRSAKLPAGFGVIFDVRGLRPLQEAAEVHLANCLTGLGRNGMKRSAVVLDDTFAMMYFAQLAQECEIQGTQRYVDASVHRDWMERALGWARDGRELDPPPIPSRPRTRSTPVIQLRAYI